MSDFIHSISYFIKTAMSVWHHARKHCSLLLSIVFYVPLVTITDLLHFCASPLISLAMLGSLKLCLVLAKGSKFKMLSTKTMVLTCTLHTTDLSNGPRLSKHFSTTCELYTKHVGKDPFFKRSLTFLFLNCNLAF